MAIKPFPVQFSVLSATALEEQVLCGYPIGKPYKCRFYTSGLNDIYSVHSPRETFYLRISAAKFRTREEVEAEILLVTYLHQNGISVAFPIQANDGSYVQPVLAPEGVRYAVLFSEAKGKAIDNPGREQNYTLGSMLARLHRCTEVLTFDQKRFQIDLKHLVDEPLDIIKPYMTHRPSEFNYLQDAGEQLKARIRALLPEDLPEYGICHGDIHHGNIHFEDNRVTLFDFDCFGYGWRAYDIAVYLWHQQLNRAASEQDDPKEKQWADFLDGYCSARPLSPNALKAVPGFVAIRDIWLLGLQIGSLDRNRGCDWLNDRYFDFHVELIKKWSAVLTC